MSVRSTEISDILRQQIENFGQQLTVTNVGTVVEIGDGIATVYGLSDVMASELVEFENGVRGLALNLGEDSVGVIIMGDYTGIEEGQTVRSTGEIASVPVGDALVGRVVNALGQPIDGKGPIATTETRFIERIAPA
jgi:F-type H+-transporting ATPase subunit alpha